MIVAGAYGLSFYMQTHMEYKDRKGATISKREFTLEEEHKKMMKQLDIENYTLSRIPRPDELPNTKERNKSVREKDANRSWLEWWNGK